MNDENKKLISQSKLHHIIDKYIKPIIDDLRPLKIKDDLLWTYTCGTDAFMWTLHNKGHKTCIVAVLKDDHWVISTGYNEYKDNEVIKVYPDIVEFNEDSTFRDFDREFMYELYMKIKEYVEGNKEDKPFESTYNTHDIQNNFISNDKNIPESVIIDWINFLIRNDLLAQVMMSSYMDYFHDKLIYKINSNTIDKGYVGPIPVSSFVEKLIKQLENNDDD